MSHISNYHHISTIHLSSYLITILPYNNYPIINLINYIRIYQITLSMIITLHKLTLIYYSIIYLQFTISMMPSLFILTLVIIIQMRCHLYYFINKLYKLYKLYIKLTIYCIE